MHPHPCTLSPMPFKLSIAHGDDWMKYSFHTVSTWETEMFLPLMASEIAMRHVLKSTESRFSTNCISRLTFLKQQLVLDLPCEALQNMLPALTGEWGIAQTPGSHLSSVRGNPVRRA